MHMDTQKVIATIHTPSEQPGFDCFCAEKWLTSMVRSMQVFNKKIEESANVFM